LKFGTYEPIPKYKCGSSKLRITKQMRSFVWQRDNYECIYCSSKAEETHHLVPVWADRDRFNDPTNIVSICKKCHNKTHFKKGRDTPISTPTKDIDIE